MKILLFGGQGRFGQNFFYQNNSDFEIIPLSSFNCDITNLLQVETFFKTINPDLIISSANYEKGDPDFLLKNNTVGNTNLILTAQKYNLPFIFISCAKTLEYSENKSSKTKPKNFTDYGKSLFLVEENLKKMFNPEKYLILRSSFFVDKNIDNIIKNTLNNLKKEKSFADNYYFNVTPLNSLNQYLKKIIITYQKNNKFSKNLVHFNYDFVYTPYNLALELNKILQLNKKISSFSLAKKVDLTLKSNFKINFDLQKFLT